MGEKKGEEKFTKSFFDVLGICCPSEVPLIEKILKPLAGIKEVSVTVPTKTVTVVHDPLLISQQQIVKALNQARLEASIKVNGATNNQRKLPSPFVIVCGILLLLSFLKYVYGPLKWLAVAAAAIGGVPVLIRAAVAVRNFTLDINFLMLISVVGSIVLHDYLEAATIVFLFTIGEWLESMASHKAMSMMSSLVNIVPQRAVLAENGEEVNADEVKLNSIVAVKAGETIPIDGIVVEGECEVEEKTLTGESFPVAKQKDSTVWAGTINLNGYISIKTTAVAADCVVARMAKLVEDAQSNKSKAQRIIDKIAKYYTPAIMVISGCLLIVPFALKLPNRNKWFHMSLVFLVSGCPCALVLSTPIAMFYALSSAAKSGLLFKGAAYLENLAKVKLVAFDKTGTITRGEFTVTEFRSLLDDVNHNLLLSWVSSIESKSSHPMAPALLDYAQSHSVESNPEKVENFQNFPGEGIYGRIDGMEIYIGNKKISARAGCTPVPELDADGKEGKSLSYIFLGSSLAGVFRLSDACRTGAQEAIKTLKLMGIKTVMLTGDSIAAARHVQEQLGGALDEFYAELLPEEKAEFIKKFQMGTKTAMVGDGINDAVALATADVGISMGISGSALAMETGQAILMTNDIGRIPKAIELARKVSRKIIENIVLAICTKAAIMALAIAGHPLVWAAVLADVGTCLLVILNSMLLLKRATPKRHNKCCKFSSALHARKHKCRAGNKSTHAHKPCCASKTESRKICKSISRRCFVKKCASRFKTNACGKDERGCHSYRANPHSCINDHGCEAKTNASLDVESHHNHSDCSDRSDLHKHEHPKSDECCVSSSELSSHHSHENEHSKSDTKHDCSSLQSHNNHILQLCDHSDLENHFPTSSDMGVLESSKIQCTDDIGKNIGSTCCIHKKHVTVLKALEERGVGGCCHSFKNECCARRNHFGGGSLSEIVIEQI